MKNLAKIKKLYLKKDKMHDFRHILRLKRNVNLLRKDYKNINERLLDFLVFYHGLKDYVLEHKKEFDKKYVKALLRHNKNPKTIEEKLVFDANMLDNVGKIGLKKALYVGRSRLRRNKKETFGYLRNNIKNVKFYTKRGRVLGKGQISIMVRITK